MGKGAFLDFEYRNMHYKKIILFRGSMCIIKEITSVISCNIVTDFKN
jgi:hypothetical protein